MLEKSLALLANHDESYKIQDLNSQKPIFKLPKHVFIAYVMSFLDGEDIVSLSSTSRIFHTMIYNSYTFQILLLARSSSKRYQPNYQALLDAEPFANFGERKLEDIDKEDYFAELEMMKALKEFLIQKAKILEAVGKSNEKEIAQLNAELNLAKERNNKNKAKIELLEQKVKSFDVVEKDHGENIKDLNLADKERKLQRMTEENQKLIKDKEVIRNEINVIKADKEKVEEMNVGFKEALERVDKLFRSGAVNVESAAEQVEK